jgi:hypothetical protein
MVCAFSELPKSKRNRGRAPKTNFGDRCSPCKKGKFFRKKVFPDPKKLPQMNKNRQISKGKERESCQLNCCFFIEYQI